jgi:hypothetical protein
MPELDGALQLVKDTISPSSALCCCYNIINIILYLVAVVSSLDGHEATAEFRDLLPLVVSPSLA